MLKLLIPSVYAVPQISRNKPPLIGPCWDGYVGFQSCEKSPIYTSSPERFITVYMYALILRATGRRVVYYAR
jgi:hypothetical protein